MTTTAFNTLFGLPLIKHAEAFRLESCSSKVACQGLLAIHANSGMACMTCIAYSDAGSNGARRGKQLLQWARSKSPRFGHFHFTFCFSRIHGRKGEQFADVPYRKALLTASTAVAVAEAQLRAKGSEGQHHQLHQQHPHHHALHQHPSLAPATANVNIQSNAELRHASIASAASIGSMGAPASGQTGAGVEGGPLNGISGGAEGTTVSPDGHVPHMICEYSFFFRVGQFCPCFAPFYIMICIMVISAHFGLWRNSDRAVSPFGCTLCRRWGF